MKKFFSREMLDGAGVKKLLLINMLGVAVTRKLNWKKMLDRNAIE